VEENATLKRTPLFPVYKRYGARLVPFGGWEMPVQFSGIIDEHLTVRSTVGLFDVSHMGEFFFEGEGALEAVQYLTINDASKLDPGGVQYSAMATAEGGLVDDITVFRLAEDRFMFCVNAANIEKDFRWVTAHMGRFPGVKATDGSARTALLALQGPRAQDILKSLCYSDLDSLPYYHFLESKVAGIDAVISRTGYTGEDGFELFVQADKGADVWEELMVQGETRGMKPCGLGARDTLRLEMGYALYGQEIDETTTPLESRLGWITKLKKGEFIGREAILRQKETGLETTLAAFLMEDRGIPRNGYPILHDDRQVGRVTSGTMSPSLRIGVGLGYVPPELSQPGTSLLVKIRERPARASVVELPFYKSGTAKKKTTKKKKEE
jgi:aminomethyltransferase